MFQHLDPERKISEGPIPVIAIFQVQMHRDEQWWAATNFAKLIKQ